MATINPSRRAALELRLGHALPAALLALLVERPPIVEGDVAFVTAERVWDVRTSYALDDGETGHQLDRLYQLIGDVLPPDTLPLASDWAGNFYCLVLAGARTGQVVYWDHERDLGDHRTELVADSLDQFFAHLVAEPHDGGT